MEMMKNIKAKLLGYVLYWISLDTKLVEAGGIEETPTLG